MEMKNDARLCPLPPSAINFLKFFFFFFETTKSKDAEIASCTNAAFMMTEPGQFQRSGASWCQMITRLKHYLCKLHLELPHFYEELVHWEISQCHL